MRHIERSITSHHMHAKSIAPALPRRDALLCEQVGLRHARFWQFFGDAGKYNNTFSYISLNENAMGASC